MKKMSFSGVDSDFNKGRGNFKIQACFAENPQIWEKDVHQLNTYKYER